jgi:hypothetical protein
MKAFCRLSVFFSLSFAMFFQFPMVWAEPKELVIDIVEVSWPGAQRPNETLGTVRRNLIEDSIPFWNSQLELTKEKSLLKMGIIEENVLLLPTPPSCEGTSVIRYIESVKNLFAKINPSVNVQERYLVILVPRLNCIWEAVSTTNEYPNWRGGMILSDVSKEFVISHELGHALGLGHSNLVACDAGKFDGAWVKDCRAIEYGGAVDLMSNIDVFTPLSTYHRWRLGAIANDDVKQLWVNEEVILNEVSTSKGTRAIFIRDYDASYWIEYRNKSFNGADKPGLVIYRTDPPPSRAIVSPNKEDLNSPDPDSRVSTDVWMLNLDDYQYLNGKAAGSMTLPSSRAFSTKSGDATLSFEERSPSSVAVKVERKADRTPPPRPSFSDELSWSSSKAPILKLGREFEDSDSTILEHEIEINSTITRISNFLPNYVPTYNAPLFAPKTILLGDLPEGNYTLRVRAVDVWGNKSAWSDVKKLEVDKSFPRYSGQVFPSIKLSQRLTLEFSGASDVGSGICLIRLVNPQGFVVGKTDGINQLLMSTNITSSQRGILQVFDCKGNGLEMDAEVSINKLDATKVRKTGKWQKIIDNKYGELLKCSGKCTASFTARGYSNIFSGSGSGDIYINSKKYGTFKSSSTDIPQSILKQEFNTRSATIRLSGSNFSFYLPTFVKAKFGVSKEVNRQVRMPDISLSEPGQKEVQTFGFAGDDFDESWSVVPIGNGTTLESPTLDFCHEEYDSESGRQIRRQLMAFKNGSPYLFLSTEVVKYKSLAASLAAEDELRRRVNECVKLSGFRNKQGIFESYRFVPYLDNAGSYKIVDNGLLIHVKIGDDNSARWLLAYYQFKGGFFSGFYVVKPAQSPFTQEELASWEEVRQILSQRLTQGT